jgi:hypothetical protein
MATTAAGAVLAGVIERFTQVLSVGLGYDVLRLNRPAEKFLKAAVRVVRLIAVTSRGEPFTFGV